MINDHFSLDTIVLCWSQWLTFKKEFKILHNKICGKGVNATAQKVNIFYQVECQSGHGIIYYDLEFSIFFILLLI